jgi:hypothetical protein
MPTPSCSLTRLIMNIPEIIKKSMHEDATDYFFFKWPVQFRMTSRNPWAWIRLAPSYWFITFNMEPEPEEKLVFLLGKIALVRPKTEQELIDYKNKEYIYSSVYDN